MRLTLDDISRAINAPCTGLPNDRLLSRPLTDSRSLLYPDETIFFALSTPSNDGHRYMRELYRRGVRNFAAEPAALAADPLPDDAFTLLPPDGMTVLDLLQRSAAYIRSLVDCPVIGITGSRGKTVIKEMLARAFSDMPIVTSPRSWNSQTGVPLSVWRLEPDTRLAIFEAGISRPGEMERLAPIISPTLGIFTGLTDEHSRDFDSIESKCREKALLFRSATHIIYIDNHPVIEHILREVNPGAELIKASSASDVVAITGSLLGLHRAGDCGAGISTRIDITEGDDGRIVAYDHFSNDLGGIETALDRFSRRVTGRRLIAVMGDPELRGAGIDTVGSTLEKLLLARGVDEIIGIGPVIGHMLDSFSPAFSRKKAASVDDYLRRYSDDNFQDAAIIILGGGNPSFEAIKQSLESTRHATCLEVNLDSLIHNFNFYRSLVKPATGMVAMVKADAYGAGAVEIAKTLQSQGAAYLAVAVVEEGLALRSAGITMPIMVLNPLTTNVRALVRNNLEPTVFSLSELDALPAWLAGCDTPYPIHIKLDTGMHRFGFAEGQLPALVEKLKTTPGVKVESIFSHLATADCTDMDDYTLFQLEAFDRMSSYIIDNLGYPIKRHILNTAGIMRYPQYQYDMVRLGIGLYGISPLDSPASTGLKPVSSLVTSISAIQRREPGETVGYGRRGLITRPSVIASLPIGYADGLNRHLGNGHLRMLVNGRECPTVGNICMDICMIDVTEADASVGDRVEIFGTSVPVTRLAETLDTIPYEVLTSVAPRVKRIYFRE